MKLTKTPSELIVIGCRAGSPGTESAASGYLLRAGEKLILIDCGPGVVLGLTQRGFAASLDAVINTHAHADHCADLVALAYHRLFPDHMRRLPLYATQQLGDVLNLLDQAFGIPSLPTLKAPLRTALDLTVVNPGDSFGVLGVQVDTLRMVHPVPTMALRFPELGFVFTADGALTDALVDFARGAECLLAEATYPAMAGRDLTGHGHMTAAQAGELAARAGVKRLVVTHLSRERDADETVLAVRSTFSGEVVLAKPGLTQQLFTFAPMSFQRSTLSAQK
jgi:ribonuclease BN (tRNA processing enzyme)